MVFNTLMSLTDNEKKATSLPAIRNESVNKTIVIIPNTVVAPVVMIKKTG